MDARPDKRDETLPPAGSPASGAPRRPRSVLPHQQHIIPSLRTSDQYISAARRMISLETRLHPADTFKSTSTASTSSPPVSAYKSAVASLADYGSPSYSSRPSPTSLPSKAKKWIRGPARRAPPNTPTSASWNNADDLNEEERSYSSGAGDTGARSGESEDDTLSGRGQAGSAGSSMNRGQNGSSYSEMTRSSTPCPTSPTSSGSEVEVSWSGEEEGKGAYSEAADECKSVGPARSEVTHTSLTHTLEEIALELGNEVSLGYEIRSFRWG